MLVLGCIETRSLKHVHWNRQRDRQSVWKVPVFIPADDMLGDMSKLPETKI